MIRRLRRRHRLIWVALAFVLPLLIIAGLMSRHAEPVNESVPKAVEIIK